MSEEFTAYLGEDEVLVQDGLEYEIVDNQLKKTANTNKEFHLIKLKYSPKKWNIIIYNIAGYII